VGTDVGHSPQTRSFRSSDCICSRSAAQLLLTQKTKLPCLATVCSGRPDKGAKNGFNPIQHEMEKKGLAITVSVKITQIKAFLSEIVTKSSPETA